MTINENLRQVIMDILGVKSGVESHYEYYNRKTYKRLNKPKLIKGVFWLPENITLTKYMLESLIILGMESIYAGDQAQCPGDQHPRLIITMKK